MASKRSVQVEYRCDITDTGRWALEQLPTCDCFQLWISEGCYRCAGCGTIYGVVFGFTVMPRKLRADRRYDESVE